MKIKLKDTLKTLIFYSIGIIILIIIFNQEKNISNYKPSYIASIPNCYTQFGIIR